MKDRFDYGLNPEKLGAVSSYLCDPETAHAEFMLVKGQYQAETGRTAEQGALCYQLRQAFPQGEVTPEEANRIGYETAMRWTKGKYQFFVCTHTDKGHIHNHIYYNSTAYDRSRKFRNFLGSSFALRRLSDRVCLEHALSVVERPKLHSKGRFLHYGQWQGTARPPSQKEQIRWAIDTALSERPTDFADFLRRMEAAGIQVVHGRGGVISFRAPGHDRAARLRASTLGAGYGPEDIQAVIDGKAPTRQPKQARPRPAPQRVNLLIDIQEKMRQGKGPAYERWAKVYNLKQMAAALQFLQEHGLTDYDALAEQTTAAVDRFHALAGEIQSTEARLSQTSELMAAVVSYAKTRPVFDGYKAAKYSKKYLAQHEAELADYRAAKAAINDILDGAKLPKMDALKKERRELADKKKALYAEYRKAQRQMRELVAVKGGVDHLLGLTDGRENKAQER
ncbi:relaxase/mobilization nuclease domain-containing protein [Flavonifractor plautii]|uniref:relaxase/mobilization nuclease domain-containing protein n=1 Tax=Flavonifractor plautii TaxID=292800 RepID=UPI00214B2CFE|nr:relaxase/mobilization nuclease domain-containing protein [Flavonifractor plautii]MCR1920297.1 relaxase/mobilization nuclease domain-containing protein [Flavonifractor plautii]